MFLVYESLLNNYPSIPDGYSDENCCIVTGYPKQYYRQTEWPYISFAQLNYSRNLFFEYHTIDDTPQRVHIEDFNYHLEGMIINI
jgi:hypothetical protein